MGKIKLKGFREEALVLGFSWRIKVMEKGRK
jgi:hypothetical protein